MSRVAEREELLRRFYQPLVLLCTLGQTRGDPDCASLFQDDIADRSLQDVRRTFLTNLAYMCDYDKGGNTVTAIGLEETPQTTAFWSTLR